jgi:N-acetylglucosamine kinase-like BadF-type ATPase
MTRYWIGIDGGGSRSRGLLVTESGDLITTAEGAGLNPLSLGWEKFRSNAEQLISRLQEAIPMSSVEAISAGLAGVGNEAIRTLAQDEIAALTGCKTVSVIPDVTAALWGAFQGGPGLLLIAGTGSICMGMEAEGKTVRSGGFGRLLGDEGGGYWIACEAAREALKRFDAGETSSLESMICEEYTLSELIQIVPRLHSGELSPHRLAGLARRILEVSARDPIAGDIVRRAGEHLARLIVATARKLQEASPRVALWGGLWQSPGHELQKSLQEALFHLGLQIEIIEPAEPPEWGAIRYLQKTHS